MFERGKLSDEFLDSLLEELRLVNSKAEGEAQVPHLYSARLCSIIQQRSLLCA